MTSGTHTSPVVNTVSARGATPMTRIAMPFSMAGRPTTAGSPPKRRRQSVSLISATGAAPGLSSASVERAADERLQAEQRDQRRD